MPAASWRSPRVLVVQHQDDCPPALVGEWLVAEGCALDVRRPYAGDALPGSTREHDALLVLGGSMGAGEDEAHDWLAPTRQLIRAAAAAGTPTLGICLGHQLAAVALGGEAGRNPRGQQLGLITVGWTDAALTDPLVSALAGATVAVQWNDDVVTRAPEHTEVLARTPSGELQVARFAPGVWGVQAHPEVDDRILAEWATEDPDRYAEGAIEDVLASIAAARDLLVAGWSPLARRLAALARGG